MLDRRHALLLLLRALPDVGYQPETATGKMLRRSTLPGPAPHHKGTCPTCNGVKRVQRKPDGPRPCAECANGVYRGKIRCVSCGTDVTGSVLREGVKHLQVCPRAASAATASVEPEYAQTWCRPPESWHVPYDLEIAWTYPTPLRRVIPQHTCVRCDACKGTGRVDYDGYTNKPVVTDQSSPETRTDQEARERRDRDRRRVDAILADPDRSLSRDAIDAFFDACERRDREAPFRELAHALDELRSLHNLAYRKVVSVCVFATERRQDLHPRVQLRLDFGVRFLDRRMPARLRIPRDLVENDRLLREREQVRFVHVRGKGDGQLGFRDREMRRLHTEEAIPVLQLCIRFGLSRSQVYAILGVRKGNGNGGSVAA